MTNKTDPADELAREMYSAALVVEGFGEEKAAEISRRQCPDMYYDSADFLLAQAGPIPDGGVA